MASRVVVAVGTKKGLFVLEGKARREAPRIARPVLRGNADQRGADRSPFEDAEAARCAELAVVRHDDSGEQGPGEEIQADEIGAGVRRG